MRSKKTPKKIQQFLDAYRTCGNVTVACQLTGLGQRTVYTWRTEDPEFRKLYEEAREEAGDLLEAEARRRALEGIEEPVYQNGKLVGYTKRYSDTLLIFLMKGANPEKYRDRWQGNLSTSGAIQVQFVGDDDEESGQSE